MYFCNASGQKKIKQILLHNNEDSRSIDQRISAMSLLLIEKK